MPKLLDLVIVIFSWDRNQRKKYKKEFEIIYEWRTMEIHDKYLNSDGRKLSYYSKLSHFHRIIYLLE